MEKLALLGGPTAITERDNKKYQQKQVNENAKQRILAMLDSGEISRSESVAQFENQFASYIGTQYALAVCNGTSALISAIYAVGIGPGDEVIVPSFSFWATSACVMAMHGIPIFADIDPLTYNMSPEDIERKVTKKTKAIVVVHVYGNPADMQSIMRIAKKYNLSVIEDCSHAHGAIYKGQKVGSIGDIGCFSLQAQKLVSAGEGGILTTNNDTFYKRAVSLGHYEKLQLIDDPAFSRFGLTGMGYKFRPHPLGVAIASEQLCCLDEMNAIRNRNALKIEQALSRYSVFSHQKVIKDAIRQFSYQYIRYHSEQFEDIPFTLILKALRAEGADITLCGFGKIHMNPLFTETPTYANNVEISQNIDYNRNVSLPISEDITDTLFICAPRIEVDGTGVEEQYIFAYEKILNSVGDLKKYEKEHMEFSNYSSRQMDMIKAITKYRKSKKEKQ